MRFGRSRESTTRRPPRTLRHESVPHSSSRRHHRAGRRPPGLGRWACRSRRDGCDLAPRWQPPARQPRHRRRVRVRRRPTLGFDADAICLAGGVCARRVRRRSDGVRPLPACALQPRCAGGPCASGRSVTARAGICASVAGACGRRSCSAAGPRSPGDRCAPAMPSRCPIGLPRTARIRTARPSRRGCAPRSHAERCVSFPACTPI